MSKWSKDTPRVDSWKATSERLLSGPEGTAEEAARRAAVRQNREVMDPIDAELQDAGVPFRVSELLVVNSRYAEALPVLRRHLDPSLPLDVQETIVRALTIPYGSEVDLRALLDYLPEALRLGNESLSFAVGNAIATVAKKKNADCLLAIASERSNNAARLKPLLQLGSWKDVRVKPIIVQMLRENDHPWYAMRTARRAGLSELKGYILPYLHHDNPEFRSEAKLFLKRFGVTSDG